MIQWQVLQLPELQEAQAEEPVDPTNLPLLSPPPPDELKPNTDGIFSHSSPPHSGQLICFPLPNWLRRTPSVFPSVSSE